LKRNQPYFMFSFASNASNLSLESNLNINKTVLLLPQNGLENIMPPRGPVPNRFVGENSHFNVTCWNDNFDYYNRQVTLALPLSNLYLPIMI
jgi:hypothetical protein